MIAIPASAAAARRPAVVARCAPAHAHVLLANAQAEVYTAVEFVGRYPERTTIVRGCAKGHKRTYALGQVEACEGGAGGEGCLGIKLERLAGPVVAFAENRVAYAPVGELSGPAGVASARWLVVVRDLRTGRVLQTVPTGTLQIPQREVTGVGYAVAIVVKSDGAVAWIAENREQSAGTKIDYEVHAVDNTGSRLLASGTGIDPHSLALAGSTLYWKQGGKPMSAPLD